MNDFRSPLRHVALFAAVILVALAMAGCTKKINAVDPSYTSPEGRTEASAQQIVYPDRPTTVYLFKLARLNCEECVDSLVSVNQVYPTGLGAINGMIFDGTAASSYQILRREKNGGYASLYDYALNPSQRFAQSGWKLFDWLDRRPSGFDPPTYLGRGIVSGVVTPTTPITNVGIGQPGDVQDILLTTNDSLRTIGWTSVDGAAGYILQIYSVKGGYANAAIHNAAPAPYASQDHLDYLVVWLPATQGTIDYSKVKVLADRVLVPGAAYLLRISAVDPQGRLVGFSKGDGFLAIGPEEGYYRVFWGGAFVRWAATGHSGGPVTARARFSATAVPAPLRSRELSLSQVKIRFSGR